MSQPVGAREPLAIAPAIRAGRAALVALIWAVGAVPVALGRARCAFAAVFHQPCPGCGMTRAIHLMERGEIAASLRMHPLALPALAINVVFAIATVWLTLRQGSPLLVWKWRPGRRIILAAAAIYACVVLLWIARQAGFLGGPVAITPV
jgi:hypothetical protein